MGFIAKINENEHQPTPKRSSFFGKLQEALEDPTGGLALGGPLAAGTAIARSAIPIAKSLADASLGLFKANPAMVFKTQASIPTKDLVLEHGLESPRALESVAKYKKLLEDGGSIPNLVVQETPEGKFLVMSGNARTAAAQQLGLQNLTADIFSPKSVSIRSLRGDRIIPK
jgi:hypothetical protein